MQVWKLPSLLALRTISRLKQFRIREKNWRIIVIISPLFSDPSSDTTAQGKLSLHQVREERKKCESKNTSSQEMVEGRCVFVCIITWLLNDLVRMTMPSTLVIKERHAGQIPDRILKDTTPFCPLCCVDVFSKISLEKLIVP